MKVKVNNKEFQPIELTITIESEKELCDLWHRLNLSKNEIDSYINTKLKYESSTQSSFSLWEILNNLVKKYNLKK